jgi:hypothetical protein
MIRKYYDIPREHSFISVAKLVHSLNAGSYVLICNRMLAIAPLVSLWKTNLN